MPNIKKIKRMNIGGQAVIEGVMMRSPERIATAVRKNNGEIVVDTREYQSLAKRRRIFNIPIIRGAIALVETLVIAIQALSFSSEQAIEDEDEEGESKGTSSFNIVLTVVAAFLLGFALFFYLPLKITEWSGLKDGVVFNLVDGVIRLIFIFLYIFLITRWKEMKRVFEYHGAEHKTIYAFEDKNKVTPDIALDYPRLHPRCSTSFLLIVVLVSVVVFIFLGRPDSFLERLIRFSFIPVIGGISYEVLKLSARKGLQKYLGFVFAPGLLLQKLTTREPDREQLEVAIVALKACIGDKVLES